MSKPKVYVHRMGSWYNLYMDKASEALLGSFVEVVSDGTRETPMSPAELVERMRGCSAILSLGGGGSHEITGDVLKSVGTVKLISIAHWCEQLTVAAKEAGVTVTEGSNANTVAVAEWTLTAALMGIRRIQMFDKALKNKSPWGEPRLEVGMLSGSTVGIAGLGRIGWYCAKYFKTMGAKVIAYDKYYTKERADKLGVELVTLDDQMKTADVISLHLPVTPETKGMLGAKEFALIKDGAVFINSARAALYDEKALIAELKKNRFTAFLDVFEKEPLPLDHPFRSMENVVITPHIAGFNSTMLLRCGREAIETLKDYFAGKGIRNMQYSQPGG
ncbi:MAG TPA: hypothetical protein DCZ94_01430 [Lentisphaeria bacterium]|nr:MAG: hypothetical protein A2X48_11350 [Lentisphaerae bacterium GWF2_49_21]HBC85592.1 hypothetical protein [Lentisphaeria bacterium]